MRPSGSGKLARSHLRPTANLALGFPNGPQPDGPGQTQEDPSYLPSGCVDILPWCLPPTCLCEDVGHPPGSWETWQGNLQAGMFFLDDEKAGGGKCVEWPLLGSPRPLLPALPPDAQPVLRAGKGEGGAK